MVIADLDEVGGEGVAADPIEAYAWLEICEAAGFARAAGTKRMLGASLTSEQTASARERTKALSRQIPR